MNLEEQRAWLDVQHEQTPSLTIAQYLEVRDREWPVRDREYERMAAEHEAAESRPSSDGNAVESSNALLPPPPPPASRPEEDRERHPEELDPTLQRQLGQHEIAFGALLRLSFVPREARPLRLPTGLRADSPALTHRFRASSRKKPL
jgi:hypothetical protein